MVRDFRWRDASLRELARLHAPGAVAELARLATKARSETSRIAAIRELLDRGYGKPSFDSKVAQDRDGEGAKEQDE